MDFVFKARIRPNSDKFSIEGDIIRVKTKPENNQANIEIIKELHKITGKEVKIIKGLKSKNKTILIKDVEEGFKL